MKQILKLRNSLLILMLHMFVFTFAQKHNLVTNGSFENTPLNWDTITPEFYPQIMHSVFLEPMLISSLDGWSSCVSPRVYSEQITCCDKTYRFPNDNDRPACYFDILKIREFYRYTTSPEGYDSIYNFYSPIITRLPSDTLSGRKVGFIILNDLMHSHGFDSTYRYHVSNQHRQFSKYSYMTNTLKRNLKKGKKYKIGFFAGINNWVDTSNLPTEPYLWKSHFSSYLYLKNNNFNFIRPSIFNEGDYTSYLTDGLGILLGKKDLNCYHQGRGNHKYPMSQYAPQFRIPSPHMSKGDWVEYTWDFVAEEDFETMTIGNFWDTSQQNMIKWKFDHFSEYKEDVRKLHEFWGGGPEKDWWRYRYLYMFMFIDSVYLYEIGSYLPSDSTVCWGETIQIKENLGREVLWIKEDGTSFMSDYFEVTASKDSTRVVAFVDGEYDTMYVFGKKTAPYALVQTDSLCIYQGRPINRFEITSSEPGLNGHWIQGLDTFEGLTYSTSEIGNIGLTVIDSVGCIQTQDIASLLYCICPVLPPDTILCLEEEIIIRDLIGCELTWLLEDGSELQSDSLRLKVSNPLHTVVARSVAGVLDTMLIQGKQVPDYQINHSDSLCHYTRKEFNKLQLLFSEQGVRVFWELNGRETTGSEFVSSDTGFLHISIQDSVNCTYTDTLYIGEYCPDFSNVCAFPNAFSPNGDGINDILRFNCINISEVQITILNRWGEVVAMSSDMDKVWDGTFKGQASQSGVYSMIVQYEVYNQEGKKLFYTGTLTLMR